MTVRKSFPLATTQFYKEITKRSGKVKRKAISKKKFERKVDKANKDAWEPSEDQDRKAIIKSAKYNFGGKTIKTKVIKKGDKGRKKKFVKEEFKAGVKKPTYKKGGYILPSGTTYR